MRARLAPRAGAGPWGRKGGERLWPLGPDKVRALQAARGLGLTRGPACSSSGRKESEQHGLRTAEKLLREFYPHTAWGQTQLRLLQGLCLLATREKANVEAALGTFIEMAQAEVCWPAGRVGRWAGRRG